MTSRKSSLTLINPAMTGVHPPRNLGHHGRKLWDQVQHEYAIQDIGGIELLAQICEALDTLSALRKRIAADGEVIQTRSGPRAHPALRDEVALRGFICRTLQRLGITQEVIRPIGRPARGIGWRPDAD
jgi:hypothetical protein